MKPVYIYDIETFPNVFTITVKHHETGQFFMYELSDRCNQIPQLVQFIMALKHSDARMVGFNNYGFDYPVLHYIVNNPTVTVTDVYNKSIGIINAPQSQRFSHIIWDNDQHVEQVDLFKIHHFDNRAKFTSLKILEFNMRSGNIQDLPYPPGTYLTPEQINVLRKYNRHDVNETEKFYLETLEKIEFREYLSKKYNRNVLNSNDTKIGKDFLINEIESVAPGSCYHKVNGKRQTRKTIRKQIHFRDVIFPYIKFEQPEFNRILNWFRNTTVTKTKDSVKGVECEVGNLKYVFGTGGMHACVPPTAVISTDDECILDIDVTSYYPSIAIVNNLYPEHLGKIFCDKYLNLRVQRTGYKKKTPENLMLKLGLNGSYGDSNNPYSPFFDPYFTMGITINGQFMLCMLAEQMIKVPGLQIIQANTDGITVKVNRHWLPHIEEIKKWWCNLTGLELEEAFYSRLFIRDVNNYVAEFEDGKLKRKGAYGYKISNSELEWHKNHSSLVVQRATEAVLVRGDTVENFIYNHENVMDFMLRTKVPRTSRLVSSVPIPDTDQFIDTPLQNTTRYYISKTGGSLVKIMPPLKNKTVDRRIGINVGWLTTECNDIRTVVPENIDYRYYINEAKKLIDPVRN